MRTLLFLCIAMVSATPGPFNASRLLFVDKSTYSDNFLFRSGSPLDTNVSNFAYKEIVAEMYRKALSAGYTMKSTPYIIDISLLDPNREDDRHCIDIEREYFKSNPTSGEFHLYPIYGNEYKPKDFPSNIRRTLAMHLDEWTHDRLISFIRRITYILGFETNRNVPTAILIHCSAGVDRTGEVIGSYQMQYQNVTYKDYIAKDTKLAGHPAPATPNKHSLDWYNHYLNHE